MGIICKEKTFIYNMCLFSTFFITVINCFGWLTAFIGCSLNRKNTIQNEFWIVKKIFWKTIEEALNKGVTSKTFFFLLSLFRRIQLMKITWRVTWKPTRHFFYFQLLSNILIFTVICWTFMKKKKLTVYIYFPVCS